MHRFKMRLAFWWLGMPNQATKQCLPLHNFSLNLVAGPFLPKASAVIVVLEGGTWVAEGETRGPTEVITDDLCGSIIKS